MRLAPRDDVVDVLPLLFVERVAALGHEQSRVHREPHRVEPELRDPREIRLGDEPRVPGLPELLRLLLADQLLDARLDPPPAITTRAVELPHVPLGHEPVAERDAARDQQVAAAIAQMRPIGVDEAFGRRDVRHELEPLVGRAVERPLLHRRFVGGARIDHVERAPAVSRDHRVRPVVLLLQRELLVLPADPRPLLDPCAIHCRLVDHVERAPGEHVDQPVEVSLHPHDVEGLPGRLAARALHDAGTVIAAVAHHRQALLAVHRAQLIAALETRRPRVAPDLRRLAPTGVARRLDRRGRLHRRRLVRASTTRHQQDRNRRDEKTHARCWSSRRATRFFRGFSTSRPGMGIRLPGDSRRRDADGRNAHCAPSASARERRSRSRRRSAHTSRYARSMFAPLTREDRRASALLPRHKGGRRPRVGPVPRSRGAFARGHQPPRARAWRD